MLRAVVLVLFACAREPDSSPCEPRAWFADADGDGHGSPRVTETECERPSGYLESSDDCDDADASISPSALEHCDGRDEDCDGSTDEDAIDAMVWYEDADGDGFGADETGARCVAAEGEVGIAGDCDDADGTVNPEADERCNERDDDCDELVDSEDDSLIEGAIWYVDGDGDGYGGADSGRHACGKKPDGMIADHSDCDDADPDVHPLAVEVCDRVDDDCNGLVDDDDTAVVGLAECHPDADGDGFGDSTVVASVCFLPAGYVYDATDCDDTDPESPTLTIYYTDRDGDGYGTGLGHEMCAPEKDDTTVGGDCAGSNPNVHPGASEVCDDVDNNCDGLEDDDDPLRVASVAFYLDADGDGFGDPASSVLACDGADGHVANDRDCDDADAAVQPRAVEWCDGIDNDCDGTADDDVVYADWYADTDGDGHGTDGLTENDCVQPAGFVSTADDCDDGAATVYPQAMEVCGNDVDENCDDVTDNCTMDALDADVVLEGITKGEFVGIYGAAGDTSGDGIADLVVGNSPWLNDDTALYLVTGPLSGTVSADADSVVLTPSSDPDWFAYGLAVGDANGDGYDDVVANTSLWTAYVFFGPITVDRSTDGADATLTDDSWPGVGDDLAILADFDGDSGPEVAVGARLSDDPPYYNGAAYVVSGATSGDLDLLADAPFAYRSSGSSTFLGEALAGIDRNADGITDLAVSGDTWYGPGTVWLVDGGQTPDTYDVKDEASATLTVDVGSPSFGAALQTGDYDGDGSADLFVGATTQVSSAGPWTGGAVYCFLAPIEGDLLSTDAEVRWDGPHALGQRIEVGDVDADGQLDVLMSSVDHDDVYLQLGAAKGTVSYTSLLTFGSDIDVGLGRSIALVPDWTGDGGAEVMLGAPYRQVSWIEYPGSALVFFSEQFHP